MGAPREANEEWFFDKVVPVPESGCWLWIGATSRRGYANARINGVGVRMNRWAYEHFVGPIPEGMLVCHSCDVTCCVNPKHLWIGTAADNTADMMKKGRVYAGLNMKARTHCAQGHPYDEENTVRYAAHPNRRYCKACRQEINKLRNQRLKAMRLAKRTKQVLQ